MGFSGIYATTTQLTDGQTNINGVEIKIHTFRLNSEKKEEKYEKSEQVIMPSEIISFIPKIENIREKCYIRTKIFFIKENINVDDYITGMSNEWKKYGEYYYYKNALNIKETVKLFDTLQIPQNISEITSSKKIKLEITAEAIQEKNFEPDYTKDDPWKGIVPTQSINTEYNIDTNSNSNTIINNKEEVSEDYEKNIKPQTGDNINVAITIFVIASIGLVIVRLLNYKNKKNNL